MVIVGLDLSTKPGYAFLSMSGNNITLLEYGTLKQDKKITDKKTYPYSYVEFAEKVALDLVQVINKYNGKIDKIIIEETTSSRNNYSQKALEFIHFAVLKELENSTKTGNSNVLYIRDGQWKSFASARLSLEEKRNNARIQRHKKKTGKKSIRKIGEEKVRKVTKHDAYIRAANERYNLNLKREDEDAAAAILLATAYFLGAPICDGTTDGGKVVKKEKSNEK
jgi:hypothetical protein